MEYHHCLATWEFLFIGAGCLLLVIIGIGVKVSMSYRKWFDKGECKPMATRVKRVSDPLDASDEWDRKYVNQLARQKALIKY